MRIDQGAADALIGCDVVVSSSPKASGTYRHGTRAVVNTAEMPTGDVVRFRDADLASRTRLRAIERVIGAGNMATVDANALAETLLGDTVYANVMMLGFAWQQGLVPVSFEALSRAIELNGVAVERNRQAFAWGRLLSADPDAVHKAAGDKPEEPETLDQVIARRVGLPDRLSECRLCGPLRGRGRTRPQGGSRASAPRRSPTPWRARCSSSWPTRMSTRSRACTWRPASSTSCGSNSRAISR